ncbi:MAG TPA: type II toxin-antitoxin system VapC family toxin [Acidobacteriota bacterium]|nr:type II toxin-antitoxin system VapC family toxin [Acidobacteriota bacterium]
MKFLLDTHVWLWSLLEPELLSAESRRELEDAKSQCWLSPISVWEAAVLVRKGRLRLEMDLEKWVAEGVRRVGLIEAPLTMEIVLAGERLELKHADPADRFLAATAVALNLTLVTADQRLLTSPGISVLEA